MQKKKFLDENVQSVCEDQWAKTLKILSESDKYLEVWDTPLSWLYDEP